MMYIHTVQDRCVCTRCFTRRSEECGSIQLGSVNITQFETETPSSWQADVSKLCCSDIKLGAV